MSAINILSPVSAIIISTIASDPNIINHRTRDSGEKHL